MYCALCIVHCVLRIVFKCISHQGQATGAVAHGQVGCLKQVGVAELINHILAELQLLLRLAGRHHLYQIQTFFYFLQ